MKLSSLRSTVVLTLGAVTRAGSQTVAALLVAREIGATEWGRVATVQVAVFMITRLTTSGSYVALIGEASRFGDRRGRPPSGGDIAALAVLSAAASWCFIAVGPGTPALAALAALLAVAMVVEGVLSEVVRGALVLEGEFGKVAVLSTSRAISVVAGAVIFVALGGPGRSNGWIVALTAASIVSAFVALPLLGGGRIRILLGTRRSARNAIQLMGIGLGSAATAALRTVDQLMLAEMSNLRAAGTYNMAVRLMDGAMLLIAASAQVSHRDISGARSLAELRPIMKRVLKTLFIVSLPIGALVPLGAVGVEYALGDTFSGVIVMSAVLSTTIVARAWFLCLTITATLAGQTRLRNGAVASSLIANIGLNLFLIPRWGGIGASIATAICEWILTLTLLVGLYRRTSSVSPDVPVGPT